VYTQRKKKYRIKIQENLITTRVDAWSGLLRIQKEIPPSIHPTPKHPPHVAFSHKELVHI
jgi:hypothetical protein